MPRRQACVIMKTCVTTSDTHPSERGSVISDGLVVYLFPANSCVLQLNNRLFEELAMDVYDEVDRRENETSKVASLHDLSSHIITLASGEECQGNAFWTVCMSVLTCNSKLLLRFA